jgi:hypothetical protein
MIALLRKFNGIVRVRRSVKFLKSDKRDSKAYSVWRRGTEFESSGNSSIETALIRENMEGVRF